MRGGDGGREGGGHCLSKEPRFNLALRPKKRTHKRKRSLLSSCKYCLVSLLREKTSVYLKMFILFKPVLKVKSRNL